MIKVTKNDKNDQKIAMTKNDQSVQKMTTKMIKIIKID